MKSEMPVEQVWLQFHLLPIRDWNFSWLKTWRNLSLLQFHLLPIRDWNDAILEEGLERRFDIAISLTPY